MMSFTGKTETIVGLLQILVQLKHTVLLVAYTKNAVDNILLRYKAISNDFMRVGESSRFCQAELKPYSVIEITKNAADVDQLTEIYNSKVSIHTHIRNVKGRTACIRL